MIAVYYFGLVTMLARDLSQYDNSDKTVSINNQQQENKNYNFLDDPIVASPLRGGVDLNRTQISEEIDVIWIIVSYFPLMPFMQVYQGTFSLNKMILCYSKIKCSPCSFLFSSRGLRSEEWPSIRSAET